MAFFSSHLGMYAAQAVLHAAIAMFIVDGLLAVWQVRNPASRFRYRMVVLLLPVFQYPLFQLLSPERGSFYFRLDVALFDSRAWLDLEAWQGFSVGAMVFWFVAVGTALLTLMQEIIPISRDLIGRVRTGRLVTLEPDPELLVMVDDLSVKLRIVPPQLTVVEMALPLAYTAGAASPKVIISSGLLQASSAAQVRAVLAHELVHVKRRSTIATLSVFLARLLLFFNPVSLLVFRRMVQDDEAICDDLTVELTGDPQSLATILRRFEPEEEESGSPLQAIESHSQALLLRDRIVRLEDPELLRRQPFDPLNFLTVIAAIVIVSYFVV